MTRCVKICDIGIFFMFGKIKKVNEAILRDLTHRRKPHLAKAAQLG